MELKRLSPSMSEIVFSDGTRLLFSYETPVAARLSRGGNVKTDKYFSRTTSGHVSSWLNGEAARVVPHDELLKLAREAR